MSISGEVYALTFGSWDDERIVGIFVEVGDAMMAAGGADGFVHHEDLNAWFRSPRYNEAGNYDGLTGVDAAIRAVPFNPDMIVLPEHVQVA